MGATILLSGHRPSLDINDTSIPCLMGYIQGQIQEFLKGGGGRGRPCER